MNRIIARLKQKAGLFEPCTICGKTTSNEDQICKSCKEKEEENKEED